MDEIHRIKTAYEKRKLVVPPNFYSLFREGNLFMVQARDRETVAALRKFGTTELGGKRILDVGCGAGGELRNLMRYGANPRNLFGVDLLEDRVVNGREISPNIDIRCGDASSLPFADEYFDLVIQMTMFTSILDSQMRQRIAFEMIRVLKNDGMILWYDYLVNNPVNDDVRGIRKAEICGLFPNCRIELKRITLAPPITRALAPFSLLSCELLESLRIFNTHYLGIIRKRIT